jgi:hypothetical protein
MGGSSHTESSTKVDPALMALYNQNYANASNVANNYSYVPYGGERVAGFTQPQQQSFGALTSAANDPTSSNAIQQSQQAVSGLLGYQAPNITAQNVNATPYNAAQLSGTDLSPYMNPFQKNVIDASISQNQYARDQQEVADNAAATAANAFGGSRQGVQRAETTGAYDRNNQQNIAALNSQNFGQAQNAALADIASRNNASQFNATQGLNASEFNAGQGLTAQQANASNALNAAQLRGQSALSNASLGQAYLNNQIQRGGILNNVGAQQQALQQAQDEAAYEEFQRQIQSPLVAQQIRNQALGMIPQQSTTSSNSSSSPGVGGILGGIGSLALGVGSLAMGNPMGIAGILGGGGSLFGQSSGPSMGWT